MRTESLHWLASWPCAAWPEEPWRTGVRFDRCQTRRSSSNTQGRVPVDPTTLADARPDLRDGPRPGPTR
jgi:hypothetical protein